MQVIEAQCASIVVPHDHLHINQESAFPRKRLVNFRTRRLRGNAMDAVAAAIAVAQRPVGRR
jgi:hypothetical protein